ncbi:bifunctional phosphoribosyl-AMP cyclohydrolase/phosphoribosyl-ATP diphosphatase HisIE [Helicovermis profundi]|uniref:Histidine biosynthesis bifunctional protein HisIE n=1 Tax=Helicovermis profundi TaxID=3065157 RepID=A0AAU9EU38_9FIRM|nr:bifunctional phosphoribosyl-AMP cyclohydrolase/phosphoribosyl-ATP diphosphatase HisIE [Clostridia bacterium S502]
MNKILSNLKYDSAGLIPCIIQNNTTNEILMLGYMNEESLKLTLFSNTVWFFSRSRQELWNKGATSGNYLHVVSISSDCDNDTILVKANPDGPTCHTGSNSCFFNTIKDVETSNDNNNSTKTSNLAFLEKLYGIINERKNNPLEGAYTTYLFNEGIDKILKKIGEESSEVIIASKNNDNKEIISETSDLVYHLFVLLNYFDITITDVINELSSREK